MTRYTVQAGDTLQFIAQKFYYNAARYLEIKDANNLTSEIVVPGQILKIPPTQTKPREIFDFTTVGIVIDDKKFEFWFNLKFTLSLDRLAPTFSFSAAYEDIAEFVDAFAPFAYRDVEIYYKDVKIISGILAKSSFDSASTGNVVTISGYGRPGMLQKMTLPKSLYPRTLYNISLKNIADKYCKPFGVFADFSSEASEAINQNFKSVKIGPTESISNFIIKLAQQRGLIASTDSDGILFFSLKSKDVSTSVLEFKKGQYPTTAEYNGDNLFSDYTALMSKSRKRISQTAKKSLDIDLFRHHTILKNDDDDESLENYIDSEIGRTLLNSISVTTTLPFWDNAEGELLQPEDVILVQNESVQIRQKTKFSIKEISFSLSDSGQTATLSLVPTSALNNEFERFWDA